MAETWILPFISLLAGALITMTVQHRLASRQRSQQVLERVAEALAATQAILVEMHPDRFLWGTQEVWIDKWSKALDEGRCAERELRVAVLLVSRPVGDSLEALLAATHQAIEACGFFLNLSLTNQDRSDARIAADVSVQGALELWRATSDVVRREVLAPAIRLRRR